MQIPMKKASKKKDNMDNMKTDNNKAPQNREMGKMDMPKANLDFITTIVTNIPPEQFDTIYMCKTPL